MKDRILFSFIFSLFLIPCCVFSQDVGRWQLVALGGAFSPSDDEIQNIYGASFTGKVAVTAPLGKRGRIRIGGSFLERKGDPFYQSRDFYLPDAGQLSLRGASLTFETRARSANNPRLYLGAGVDYVFGREKINGLDASTGGAIGAHVSLTPEIDLTSTLAFTAEISYEFLELTFRNGRNRYKFNLSGARMLAGLAFKLGN